MDKLLSILLDINPSIDYETATGLVDDGLLDSLSILSLVTEIESTFDVEISPIDLIPANFNSVDSLWKLICRLRDEA
ncbi:MAG: phosphopantetheine-binding protein [Erysipelothrix sp.]